ncbi:MAG TPA: FAD-dependent oxidoreductase [Bacteroidales bacterium]|jgi:thioredoxin reductase (NADPH)|nr:FAD-dependent oxidoreductase [Bacteroidales bacterium]HOS70952.1 FAD-dependent oxidoreductase [Bacteroidales bacterium]HQH23262.1 FAD-dependent oxidoreductase [Bacteroidales bacterium]HQJ80880.1 FAD-dependent oxidoreductase [Bacteroidales bacterium]
MNGDSHYDAIVIGAGPAGLTAGIYLSRARLRTLILNEGTVGGQLVLTHEIANYPGVESINGYRLSGIMKKQALSFGCDIRSNITLTGIELKDAEKRITLSDGSVYTAGAVILSPGGRPRTLGVRGEEELRGRGISYCSTCDGDFFAGREIIVVGGGNSALEEAVSLTKHASKVTVIHQFGHFQAFEYAIEEARNNPRINFIMESVVTGFNGEEKLESVDIKNLVTGETGNLRTEGAFVFIGYVPNTGFLEGMVPLNRGGEIIVDSDMSVNIEGVYAAGDCTAGKYRQVTTAVGEGTIAALAASAYISELRVKQKQAAEI